MLAIKRVLVATDFSEFSTAALDYGRELARTYGATLYVLHVAEDFRRRYSLDMSAPLYGGMQEDFEAMARTRLAAVVTDEDRMQLNARQVVVSAPNAAEAIVDFAKVQNIDVVVMGTHGRTGLAHMLLGSVTERVVRLAPCPVLTVRHPEHECIGPDALVAVAKG